MFFYPHLFVLHKRRKTTSTSFSFRYCDYCLFASLQLNKKFHSFHINPLFPLVNEKQTTTIWSLCHVPGKLIYKDRLSVEINLNNYLSFVLVERLCHLSTSRATHIFLDRFIRFSTKERTQKWISRTIRANMITHVYNHCSWLCIEQIVLVESPWRFPINFQLFIDQYGRFISS